MFETGLLVRINILTPRMYPDYVKDLEANIMDIKFGGYVTLFNVKNSKKMNTSKIIDFILEKYGQCLIINNIQTVFNCRFIASEYSTYVTIINQS